jgi:hypothetical protein
VVKSLTDEVGNSAARAELAQGSRLHPGGRCDSSSSCVSSSPFPWQIGYGRPLPLSLEHLRFGASWQDYRPSLLYYYTDRAHGWQPQICPHSLGPTEMSRSGRLNADGTTSPAEPATEAHATKPSWVGPSVVTNGWSLRAGTQGERTHLGERGFARLNSPPVGGWRVSATGEVAEPCSIFKAPQCICQVGRPVGYLTFV